LILITLLRDNIGAGNSDVSKLEISMMTLNDRISYGNGKDALSVVDFYRYAKEPIAEHILWLAPSLSLNFEKLSHKYSMNS
jgi:hypothetical protein